MQLTELRLGNRLDLNGTEAVVVAIGSESVLVINKEASVVEIKVEDLKPLLITGNILVRLGFEETRTRQFVRDVVRLIKGVSIRGYQVYFEDKCLFVIEYVHELQNLYFALLGTELQWKQ